MTRTRETIEFLPPEYRWEFTRRHPYYLLFWESARRHQLSRSQDPRQTAADEVSWAILLLIGVTGTPINPATPFSELGNSPLPCAWANGAVSQLTIRSLAGCFLSLPQSVRRSIGQLLIDSASVNDDDMNARVGMAQRLTQFTDSAFDCSPVAPLLGINLNAPQRAIVESVEEYVRTEKERLGIPERRRREESLPDFLAVWDQHEGWTGRDYSRTQYVTFREIGQELATPIETIRNRYNSAFQYITGHEYTPALWFRLFGILKLSQVFGTEAPHWRTIRRPRESPRRRPVPLSRLSSADTDARSPGEIFGSANEIGALQSDSAEIFSDILSMIAAGASNEEIIEALELASSMASQLIDHIRNRRAEGL